MAEQNILTSMTTELRRGTLSLAVLSQLFEPRYGYSLLKCLEEKGIQIEANTLYPLMRRLETQGLLENSWDTSSARPRKYYVFEPGGQGDFCRAHQGMGKQLCRYKQAFKGGSGRI